MEDVIQKESLSNSIIAKPYSPRRYLVGFVLAMILIDVIEIFIDKGILPYLSTSRDFLACLMFGQMCLLSIWVGLGSMPVTYRCFLTLAILESWCFLMPFLNLPTYSYYGGQAKEWFNNFVPAAGTIAIMLWIGRLFGLKLFNIHLNSEPLANSPNRFQYSLRSLLEWNTIVAIFFASLSYIFGFGYGFVVSYDWKKYVFVAGGYASISLLLAWAILSLRFGIVHIVVQIVAVYLILRFLSKDLTPYTSDALYDGAFVSSLLAACLWFFRGIGYRVIWTKMH